MTHFKLLFMTLENQAFTEQMKVLIYPLKGEQK